MKKMRSAIFRGPTSYVWMGTSTLLTGLTIVGMQNCSQPYGLDKSEYTPPKEALTNSVQSLDGKMITSNREFKMALAYPYAEEVYISADEKERLGVWEPLRSPHIYQLEGDDAIKSLYIKFRNFSKRESDWTELHVTLDTTAPTVDWVDLPASPSNQSEVSLGLSANDNLSGVDKIECRVDEEPFAPCTGPIVRAGLEDGQHQAEVRARDKAGNVSTPKVFSWIVDSEAPDLGLSSKPARYTKETSANFVFGAQDALSEMQTFRCRLDRPGLAGTFADCTSPKSYAELGQGNHIFHVEVTDSAANKSVVKYEWTVDTVLPNIRIVTAPKALDVSRKVQFVFEALDTGGSGIERSRCILQDLTEGAAVATAKDCVSPVSYTVPKDAEYRFTVSTYDRATNAKTAPTATFRVDATPVKITQVYPDQGFITAKGATFRMEFDDQGGSGVATIKCKVNEEAERACSASTYLSGMDPLKTNKILYTVTDKAGNVSNRTIYFKVDLVNPTTPKILAEPDNPSTKSWATFRYESIDDNLANPGYMCQLDNGPVEPCGSSKSYSGLTTGTHAFRVYAIDRAGRKSELLKEYWKVVLP